MLSQILGEMKGVNWKTWLIQGRNCPYSGSVLLSGGAQIIFETQCDSCGRSTSPGHSTAAVRPFPPERQGVWRARHWTALQSGGASRLSGELLERSHRCITTEW